MDGLCSKVGETGKREFLDDYKFNLFAVPKYLKAYHIYKGYTYYLILLQCYQAFW
jgi:hypothetical protein